MVKSSRDQLLCLLISLAALVLYLVAILTTPSPLTYDEPLHLITVPLLKEHGPTIHWLQILPNSPGPLYPILHWAAEPLTGLRPPGVRLVNFVLLLLTLLAVGATLY